MTEIQVADIMLAGEPEKKEYEATPLLPARTGWLIPFTYQGVDYKLHVVEKEGHFSPIAVYQGEDRNTVIPMFVYSQSKYAMTDKLLQDAKII